MRTEREKQKRCCRPVEKHYRKRTEHLDEISTCSPGKKMDIKEEKPHLFLQVKRGGE